MSSLLMFRLGGLHPALFHGSLLHPLLTRYAVTCPGNSLEPLGINLAAAGDTLPEVPLPNSFQSSIDHVQQLPIIVTLGEEELLGVGICGAVGDILCSLGIGYAAIFFRTRHRTTQLLLPGFQLFPKLFELLLFHTNSHPPKICSQTAESNYR